MTPHTALFLEQELGSTVQYGRVVLSIVSGNPRSVLSPVPSATLLYCADVRLTLREWLDALIGRDVLSERSVETEATRLLPSRPRVSQRIGNPSEA